MQYYSALPASDVRLRRFVHRTIFAVGLIAIFTAGFASAASPLDAGTAAPTVKAVDFELKDQYNQPSTYRFPKQKVTVLIFGDRKGSEQIEGWVRPLWDRYRDRIDQKGVAVLDSVPSLMRGVVRAIFRNKVKYSVLLDWTGEVSKSYNYQSGRANLVLIDRQGTIILKMFGVVDNQGLAQLTARIDQLLTGS